MVKRSLVYLLIALVVCAGARDVDRVAEARRLKSSSIHRQFSAAGLKYPPQRLYIRAFKAEMELELWASSAVSEPMKLLRTYPIAKTSGQLGPKLKKGDRQVPEGFYSIDRYNDRSKFLLSLGINYPNARDKALGEKRPGGDIFIHGSNVSIGCLAMTDDVIREIYVIALDTKTKPVPVHIFPFRMNRWPPRAAEHLRSFWQTLKPAYDSFEKTRVVPGVKIVGASYVVPTMR